MMSSAMLAAVLSADFLTVSLNLWGLWGGLHDQPPDEVPLNTGGVTTPPPQEVGVDLVRSTPLPVWSLLPPRFGAGAAAEPVPVKRSPNRDAISA